MLPSKSLSHEEYLRRKRRKKLWKAAFALLFIILIVGFASYVSHRREVRISKVELNGGILVTQSDLESKTLERMYGSYFWLFPKNNALWYPRADLENYLKETFKRIDTIDIHLKGFKTLVVNIKERKPFAIWCDRPEISAIISTTTLLENVTSSVDKQENCYFIDQNSTIFAKAPTFSGDAYFKYYGTISLSDGSPIGKEYIASTTEFNEISDFVAKVKSLLVHPLYIVAKEDGEFSLFLLGGGEVYFNLKESLSVTAQNLEVLLRTPPFASSTGNLPIQYIDLRYGNKLFYKLKQ